MEQETKSYFKKAAIALCAVIGTISYNAYDNFKKVREVYIPRILFEINETPVIVKNIYKNGFTKDFNYKYIQYSSSLVEPLGNDPNFVFVIKTRYDDVSLEYEYLESENEYKYTNLVSTGSFPKVIRISTLDGEEDECYFTIMNVGFGVKLPSLSGEEEIVESINSSINLFFMGEILLNSQKYLKDVKPKRNDKKITKSKEQKYDI